jgi:hypothetical protein
MRETKVVVATGLFSLAGVGLGALLVPLTQVYVQNNQEQRAAERAELLVAGELLHAQLTLRAAAASTNWPPLEDIDRFLPTSAWQDGRSSLAGKIDEDLWNKLVMAYAFLEIDRVRFVMANRVLPVKPLLAEDAEGLNRASNNLDVLRRQLGGGGAWLDEIQDEIESPK